MSMKHIKTTLETDIYNKYNDTNTIKPLGVNLDTSSIDLYIAPSIEPIRTKRFTMGGEEGIRELFFLEVLVYLRIGTGTGDLYDLVDSLKGNYNETKISNIVLFVPEMIDITEQGEWLVSGIRVTGEYLTSL